MPILTLVSVMVSLISASIGGSAALDALHAGFTPGADAAGILVPVIGAAIHYVNANVRGKNVNDDGDGGKVANLSNAVALGIPELNRRRKAKKKLDRRENSKR